MSESNKLKHAAMSSERGPPPPRNPSAQRLLSSFEELTRALRQIERGKKTDGEGGDDEKKASAVDEQLELFVQRFSRSKAATQPGISSKSSRSRRRQTGLKRPRREMATLQPPLSSTSVSASSHTRGGKLSSSTGPGALERMLGADLSLTSKSENALYGSLRRQGRGRNRGSWNSASTDNAGLQQRLHRAQQRGRRGKKLIAAAAERHAAAQRMGYATAPRQVGMEVALQLVKETSGPSFLKTPSREGEMQQQEHKPPPSPSEDSHGAMHFPQWGWEESVEQELIPHRILKESEPPAVTMVFGAGRTSKYSGEEKRSNAAQVGANMLNLIDGSVFFEVSVKRYNQAKD